MLSNLMWLNYKVIQRQKIFQGLQVFLYILLVWREEFASILSSAVLYFHVANNNV